MNLWKLLCYATLLTVSTSICAENFDIAPYSELRSTPYAGFSLTRLLEGASSNRQEVQFCDRGFQTDIRIQTNVTFDFGKSYQVDHVELLAKPNMVTKYEVSGCSKENGSYELLGTIDNHSKSWQQLKLEGKKLYGIKIQAVGGDEAINFGLNKVKILVTGNKPEIKKLESKYPELQIQATRPLPENKTIDSKLKKVLFLRLRSFIHAPELQAARIKDIGFNTVILYCSMYASLDKYKAGEYHLPENKHALWYFERWKKLVTEDPFYANPKKAKAFRVVGWPSKISVGTKKNYLKGACEVLHKYGIKVIASAGLGVKRYFKHPGQNDSHCMPGFPCMLHDEFVRETALEYYKEAIDSGADGIVLGADEMAIEGHRFCYMSPYDPCLKLFKDKYGYKNMPLDAEDSLLYRRWVTFEYDGFADLFKYWAKKLREYKPDVITTCLPAPWGLWYSDRMGFGVAYDILGHKSGMDYITTDYYRPLTTIKRLIAASRNRKAGYVMNLGKQNKNTLDGQTISILGQTGKELASIEYYRDADVGIHYPKNKKMGKVQAQRYKWTKNLFKLLAELEKQGMTQSAPPKDIALLLSRSSEDWWQLKNNYIQAKSAFLKTKIWGSKWKQEFTKRISPERTRCNVAQMIGYNWNQAVIELLSSCNYNFDIFFMDQPNNLKNLTKYKLLLLPFAYSVSNYAVKQVERALNSGSRLMIVNHLGEVDEYGNKRSKPAFAKYLKNSKVNLLNTKLINTGQQNLEEIFCPLLDKALPNRAAMTSSGPNLQGRLFAYFLEKNDKFFISLVNYDNYPREVEIKLPKEITSIELFDSNKITKMKPVNNSGFTYKMPASRVIVFVAKTK